MGAGNDSISFSGTGGHKTTTYYFGKTDGKDTLTFANVATSGGITIAVDAAYGSTAGILYGGNLDAGTGTSELSPSTMLKAAWQQELCSLATSLAVVRLKVLVSPTSLS